MGIFDKLKQGLQKTKELLRTDIRDLFRSGEILDETKLEALNRRLITTDMGVTASEAIVEELREKYLGRTVVIDDVLSTVKDKLKELLRGNEGVKWDVADPLSPLQKNEQGVTVFLIAGVNGVGKTTSIAKLANLLKKQGKKVMLAAGDTFRAAAVEQLTMWSERLGCEIVTKASGSDPASVAYSACERAVAEGMDVLILDTAGRLHTDPNLMKQLAKIRRVIGDKIPGAPHEVLMVLDAVTGQNGINQAQKFNETVECTGIILAKLDGSAKGGVVVAIRQQMELPVKYVGVGEKVDDLELFDPDQFVEALFSA